MLSNYSIEQISVLVLQKIESGLDHNLARVAGHHDAIWHEIGHPRTDLEFVFRVGVL